LPVRGCWIYGVNNPVSVLAAMGWPTALAAGKPRGYGQTIDPGTILTPAQSRGPRAQSRQVRSFQEFLVRLIFKICSATAWREAERQGVYRGSSDDIRDGFIHFSTASQVGETARKHFSGQTGLLLVAVNSGALGDTLRWERSRNDELFPHLYGELDLSAVTAVRPIRTLSGGSHEIPELES
jgi:uncharacterized protein (DUF952 family)